MPWTTDDSRIRSLPKKGRELWVRVANGYLEDHPGEDVSAIRIAWSAVGNAGYKKEGHKWDVQMSDDKMDNLIKAIHPFGQVPISFAKAYYKGKDRYIAVKASGLKVDRQLERMMPSAIEDMVAACKSGKVDLLDNHFSSFEMGKSTDAEVNEDGEMTVEFKLNDTHPNVDQLYKEIEAGDCKRQASVGGNVTESKFEYDRDLGKAVKQLHHVDLDHIAVTREGHSAYPDAQFTAAIAKQVHLRMDNFGGDRMGHLKALIEELKKSAAIAVDLQKTAFKITPEMLDDKMVLKAEFQEAFKKSVVSMDKDETKAVADALGSILKALGIPMVKEKNPQPSSGAYKDAMEAHKEAMDLHKEAMDAHKDAMDLHGKAHKAIGAIKDAMEDGAVPEAVHTAIDASKDAMDAHKDAYDAHKDAFTAHKEAYAAHKEHGGQTYGMKFMKEAGLDVGFDGGHNEGTDTTPDSGTGKDGKEETRPKKNAPKAEDGMQTEELADGPGTAGMHQGNGSTDGSAYSRELKAISMGMVKKLKAELMTKLERANAKLEEVKKDAHVTKDELMKKMLEVAELKKDIEKLKSTEASPRPGTGQRLEKGADTTDGRAVTSVIKSLTSDPNEWMVKLQSEVDQLAKMRGTKSWSETMAKEAAQKAQILKAAISMGPEAAMAMYGIEVAKA